MFKNLSFTKKRILSNALSLSILQGVNYILPLVTIPYLIRVLGIEYFGLLAFVTAVIMYFSILTDYGFNLSATKEISLNRDNKEKLIEIFSSVITIKLILLMLSFFILLLLTFIIDKFYEYQLIYLLTFGTVIGQVFFPVWFFQGMERMKYITYLTILSKSIFTIAIFIFVTEERDYYLVPLFTALGGIIAGILSLIFIKKEFDVSFKWQEQNVLLFYLKDGWHIFLSRIYANLYSTTNVVLLGFFTNNTVVGYYAIAEKIVAAIANLFLPINQALYPYLVKSYKNNFKNFTIQLKKISIIFIFSSVSLFLIANVFGDIIVKLVTGENNSTVMILFSILLFRVVTYPFGPLYSNGLIIMNEKKRFIKVMNYTVLINLLIVPVLIYSFQAKGLAIGFIIVLVLHCLLLLSELRKSIGVEING